jgi:hypothetical protein
MARREKRINKFTFPTFRSMLDRIKLFSSSQYQEAAGGGVVRRKKGEKLSISCRTRAKASQGGTSKGEKKQEILLGKENNWNLYRKVLCSASAIRIWASAASLVEHINLKEAKNIFTPKMENNRKIRKGEARAELGEVSIIPQPLTPRRLQKAFLMYRPREALRLLLT